MYPRIGSLPTYGILYIISFVIYLFVAFLLARGFKLRRRVWIVSGICYIFAMTIGAKILFDIQMSQFSFRALFSMAHYKQGGLWGGLLAYFILSIPLIFLLSSRKREALDLIAISIPVPFIFAKLGCLFNGCCYGKPCNLPWAITFPEASRIAPTGIPLHPTQIYEIILMLIIMIFFIRLRNNKWRGTRILWFLVLYGFGRAIIEIFRGDFDHHRYIGPLTLSQLLCIAAAGISALLLIVWFILIRKSKLELSKI
ncbi:MAG: prolipoprotein diacylglyceryl transferase [Sedimentisphaerales bacterium]|nr:prolipoprotein diacylglyceryl transferase [Sedimentisphaerales bacterium]